MRRIMVDETLEINIKELFLLVPGLIFIAANVFYVVMVESTTEKSIR